jgi:transcriptional regulator with XRE-family HTH domain
MSIDKIEKGVKDILEIVRYTRKQKGLSQREVAEFLNISQNAYKDIETGKTELKVKTLFQLDEFLGLDLRKAQEPTEESKEEVQVAINTETVGDFFNLLVKNDIEQQGALEEIKSNMVSKTDFEQLKTLIVELLSKDTLSE